MIRSVERSGSNADDSEALAIHDDLSSDDRRVAVEATLPKVMTRDGDGTRGGYLVRDTEPASQNDASTDRLEHVTDVRSSHTRDSISFSSDYRGPCANLLCPSATPRQWRPLGYRDS